MLAVMQFDATSFHPEMTIKKRMTRHFARRVSCIVNEMTSPEDAAIAVFAEVGELYAYHGQASAWRKLRRPLWLALKHRSAGFQNDMDAVLDFLARALVDEGYGAGWALFEQEIRPKLCWVDTF